jgi:hypothetical protein
MRRRLLALGLILAVTLPVGGAESYVDRAYRRGEVLEFTLSWLRVVGGSATMTIAPAAEGELRIYSLAQSNAFFSKIFKVRDEIESIVSRESFSTKRFHKTLRERKRFKEELTVVDAARGVALRKGKEIPVPPRVFDPLSLIFYLRTQELTVGVSHNFTILVDDEVHAGVASVIRRETITTEAGTYAAVVVEPRMRGGGIFRDDPDNQLFIWYSDDERRLPLRIKSIIPAGTITASLTRYRLQPQGSRQ